MPKRVPDPPPRRTGEEPAEFLDFLPGIDWVDRSPASVRHDRQRRSHAPAELERHRPTDVVPAGLSHATGNARVTHWGTRPGHPPEANRPSRAPA